MASLSADSCSPVLHDCQRCLGVGLHYRAQQKALTVARDGADLQILTDGQSNYGFPSWSGDGRHIVYREATRERNALLVLDVESCLLYTSDAADD